MPSAAVFLTAVVSHGPSIADAAILNNFRRAREAEYRHGNRSGCLKGTRSAILDKIEFWTRDFHQPRVYWLNGLAGIGKSAIAQTISERVFANGELGASFFCSRDSEDRRNLQSIFPTLAVQLARKYPEFRSVFVPLARSDPEIANESLYGQMNKLIFQPLIESGISTVIVIDALDECRDEEPVSAILSVLNQFVTKIPSVKFFITSRPEPHIREGFRLPPLAKETDVFVLHEIESSQANQDIRRFFTHKFMELRGRRRELGDWPTEGQLDFLCERAAGLFVHAMATTRYIHQRNSNPKERLDRLLQLPWSSTFEGRTNLKLNTTLDVLYTTILHEAFGNDDPEDDSKIRSVLGAVVLVANPLPPSAIAALLNFKTEDISPLLSSAHSFLILHEDIDRPVRPFHKSFLDFITDPTRCSNPRFCIRPSSQHIELLIGCLERMNGKLGQNMCELPDGVLNSDICDLKERVEKCIDKPLQYACRSWHRHLIRDTPPAQKLKIATSLHQFLEKKFVFWLEVLSVLGATREAVDALESTRKWLDVRLHPTPYFSLQTDCRLFQDQPESPLSYLVDDCFRFLLTFIEVVSTSASHIYISALPLSPHNSILHNLYQQHARPLVKVVQGLPSSWHPAATAYHTGFTSTAAWSPCNKFIAVAKSGKVETFEGQEIIKRVEILDAVTLKQHSALEQPMDSPSVRLNFSPDSRFLTQLGAYGNLATWDLQTGSLVNTEPSKWRAHSTILSSTYSPDGRMFAFAREDPNFSLVLIVIYDPTRMRTNHHSIWEGRFIPPIWTHGERLRFATLESRTITVWEVAFIGTDKPTRVGSLPAPDRSFGASETLLFLPTPPRLAFSFQGAVLVWDARDSTFLLNLGVTTRTKVEHMSFSSDGRFFAWTTRGEGIHVWKESPAGYTPHQEFGCAAFGTKSLFSPNDGSIVAFNFSSTAYLFPMEGPSLPYITSQTVDPSNFILGFFRDEEFAAVARLMSRVVTVFDLRSGDPLVNLEVGMGVFCLGAAENTLVVVSDEGKVITWTIPPRGSTPDTWKNVTDNGGITTLNHSNHPRSRYRLDPFHDSVSISPDLNQVAIMGPPEPPFMGLAIYDIPSGKCLASVPSHGLALALWFTPERQLLYLDACRLSVEGWAITGDGKSSPVGLESLSGPPGRSPWESPRGYKVMDDGWMLSSSGKRILWLPHYWRSGKWNRIWCGRFLGLLQHALPNVVVLEFRE